MTYRKIGSGAPVIMELTEVRTRVDNILEDYLAKRTKRASLLAPRYGELWQALSDTVRGGGKRIRPYLMVLAYESYGGKADERVLRAAVGLEMLHQALLMHDDVIDRDYVRHGKPNVAGIFWQGYDKSHVLSGEDKIHLSHSAAILSGDLAIAASYDLVRTSGLAATDVLRLEGMIDEAIFTVVGGELLDSEAIGTDIATTDVDAIASMKTANYSFIVPLVSGAQLASATETDITALRKLGHELGVTFQLVDDLLGVFGDEAKTGKSILSDLEEGKHTFLTQYAFAQADEQDKRTLTALLGKKGLTAKESDALRNVLVNSGAKQACDELVSEHTAEAKAILATLAVDEAHRQALRAIADKIALRDH